MIKVGVNIGGALLTEVLSTDAPHAVTWKGIYGNRPVVVKFLHDKMQNEAYAQRFQRIMDYTQRIADPKHLLVPISYSAQYSSYDPATGTPPLWLITDQMTVGNLSKLKGGKFGNSYQSENAISIARAVCLALKDVPQHGNLKLENVLLTEEPHPDNPSVKNRRVKLADMHFCLLQGNDWSDGDPIYMSPEQAAWKENADILDHRSDIYSLGVILYRLTTNLFPFHLVPDRNEMRRKHTEESVMPPRHYNDELPPELDALILRCLAKRPDDRYQSWQELLDALAAVGSAYGRTAQNHDPAPAAYPAPPAISAGPHIRLFDPDGRQYQDYRMEGDRSADGTLVYSVGFQDGVDIPIARPSDNSLKGRHCDLIWNGREMYVRPLGGQVSLAGRPIAPTTEARWLPGDTLRIGRYTLVYTDPQAGAGPSPAPPDPGAYAIGPQPDEPPFTFSLRSNVVTLDARLRGSVLITLQNKTNAHANLDVTLDGQAYPEPASRDWFHTEVARNIALPPQGTREIRLPIEAPEEEHGTLKAGRYSVDINFRTLDGQIQGVKQQLTVIVDGKPELRRIRVVPKREDRNEASYEVVLENTGRVPARVELVARTTTQYGLSKADLQFDWDNYGAHDSTAKRSVMLDALSGPRTFKLDLHAPPRPLWPFWESKRWAFAVEAATAGADAGMPDKVELTFDQPPRFSQGQLRVLALIVAGLVCLTGVAIWLSRQAIIETNSQLTEYQKVVSEYTSKVSTLDAASQKLEDARNSEPQPSNTLAAAEKAEQTASQTFRDAKADYLQKSARVDEILASIPPSTSQPTGAPGGAGTPTTPPTNDPRLQVALQDKQNAFNAMNDAKRDWDKAKADLDKARLDETSESKQHQEWQRKFTVARRLKEHAVQDALTDLRQVRSRWEKYLLRLTTDQKLRFEHSIEQMHNSQEQHAVLDPDHEKEIRSDMSGIQ
jgi:hypothetical protein